MGTMVIFYLIYIACVFLSPLFKSCGNLCKCCKSASKKFNRSIYWGVLITLINETYMIVVVSVLINI